MLRRFLKIKAYSILIAWLTIFVHNAIPHNHIYENLTCCKELIHNSFHGNYNPVRSSDAITQSPDAKICHVSTFLFSNFNHDNLIVHFSQDFIFNSDPLIDKVISVTEQSYISDHFHGTTSFRAPPVA